MAMLNASNWLVVDLPLWKMMEFVKWDDDIPNWMESHKSHVNQTTNQQNYLLVSWSSLQPVGTCLAGNDWQIFRDLTGKMAASYPQNLHQKWPKTMHCSPCMNSFDWQTSKNELRGTCSTWGWLHKMGYPLKWIVYKEKTIKMNDLGVPPF